MDKLFKVFSVQVFVIWIIGFVVGWAGGVLSALNWGAMAYTGIIGGVVIIAIGYFIVDKIVYSINTKK